MMLGVDSYGFCDDDGASQPCAKMRGYSWQGLRWLAEVPAWQREDARMPMRMLLHVPGEQHALKRVDINGRPQDSDATPGSQLLL